MLNAKISIRHGNRGDRLPDDNPYAEKNGISGGGTEDAVNKEFQRGSTVLYQYWKLTLSSQTE